MTQAVEVVLANNAAFNDRDVEAMLALYAPDAVVVDRRPLGLGQFNGHAELRPYYASIFNAVEALNEDIRVLADRGDTLMSKDEELDPELAAAKSEAKGRFRRVFSTLPQREREIAVMLYVKNLTLAEIGEVLGVSESRVCQIHGQTKKKLRQNLQDDAALFHLVA